MAHHPSDCLQGYLVTVIAGRSTSSTFKLIVRFVFVSLLPSIASQQSQHCFFFQFGAEIPIGVDSLHQAAVNTLSQAPLKGKTQQEQRSGIWPKYDTGFHNSPLPRPPSSNSLVQKCVQNSSTGLYGLRLAANKISVG
jgi:hypothetical protein